MTTDKSSGAADIPQLGRPKEFCEELQFFKHHQRLQYLRTVLTTSIRQTVPQHQVSHQLAAGQLFPAGHQSAELQHQVTLEVKPLPTLQHYT